MIGRICKSCGQLFQADPWVDDIDFCRTCKPTADPIEINTCDDEEAESVDEVTVVVETCKSVSLPELQNQEVVSSPTMDFIADSGIEKNKTKCPAATSAHSILTVLKQKFGSMMERSVKHSVFHAVLRIIVCGFIFSALPVLIDSLDAYSRPQDEIFAFIDYLSRIHKRYGNILPEAGVLHGELWDAYIGVDSIDFPEPAKPYYTWAFISKGYFVLVTTVLLLYFIVIVANYIDSQWLRKRFPPHRYPVIDKMRYGMEWLDKLLKRMLCSPWFACINIVFMLCPVFPIIYIIGHPVMAGEYPLSRYYEALIVLILLLGGLVRWCWRHTRNTITSRSSKMTMIKIGSLFAVLGIVLVFGLITYTSMRNHGIEMETHMRSVQKSRLDDDISEALTARHARIGATPSSETLNKLRLETEQSIGAENRRITNDQDRVEREITTVLERYKEEWSVIAADFQPTMKGAQDFLEHLDRLEREELVRHEQNFLNLLRQQGMQRLVTLSDQLDRERKAIHERLALVNEGLKDKEYSPGSHLHIRSQDLHDETVKQFKEDMAAAFAYTLGGSEEVEPAVLEERFLALSRLVNRLKSQESVDVRWRELVLDVRRHVEFIGLETINATGEVRTHRGSQGKSGGQRQKLTATCLAAALRYQLGGVDGIVPAYTTVALDEAFDKADHHFTRQVMAIFASFGFQMIVSTPMKSVRTLEPFIGGACVVNIRDERHSSVCAIEYDEANQRLCLDDAPVGEVETAESVYVDLESSRPESGKDTLQSGEETGGLTL